MYERITQRRPGKQNPSRSIRTGALGNGRYCRALSVRVHRLSHHGGDSRAALSDAGGSHATATSPLLDCTDLHPRGDLDRDLVGPRTRVGVAGRSTDCRNVADGRPRDEGGDWAVPRRLSVTDSVEVARVWRVALGSSVEPSCGSPEPGSVGGHPTGGHRPEPALARRGRRFVLVPDDHRPGTPAPGHRGRARLPGARIRRAPKRGLVAS